MGSGDGEDGGIHTGDRDGVSVIDGAVDGAVSPETGNARR